MVYMMPAGSCWAWSTRHNFFWFFFICWPFCFQMEAFFFKFFVSIYSNPTDPGVQFFKFLSIQWNIVNSLFLMFIYFIINNWVFQLLSFDEMLIIIFYFWKVCLIFVLIADASQEMSPAIAPKCFTEFINSENS